MKRLFFICLICAFSLLFCINIYAEYNATTKQVATFYNKFENNSTVVKITSACKAGWKSFKKWFSQLPGIKQYNNSVYAGDNWKRTMNKMGNEYSVHLKKDGAGTKMAKKIKNNF